MHRERTRVQREFRRPKNRRLSFPLFWETIKEDAISYRDWRSEIEDTLGHGHDAAKVKLCLRPWKVWPETTPR